MSDPTHKWLISLGANSKDIHRPIDRLRWLCDKFGLDVPKTHSKGCINRLFKSIKTTIAEGATVKHNDFVVALLESFPSNAEMRWDLSHRAFCRSRKFYQSQYWKNLRLQALEKSNKCQACGKSPEDGIVLHVDHILPRSIYPEYAMNLNNLQILCAECNMGKGNMHEKDFRPKAVA